MSDDLLEMQWLLGDSLTSVEYDVDSDSWSLAFGTGSWLGVHCLWRLLRGGRVAATSADHGHQFGLPQPFDAINALRAVASLSIAEIGLRRGTADLTLRFDDESTVLEIVPTSAAYEAWHAVHRSLGEVVATGGGQLMKIASRKP